MKFCQILLIAGAMMTLTAQSTVGNQCIWPGWPKQNSTGCQYPWDPVSALPY